MKTLSDILWNEEETAPLPDEAIFEKGVIMGSYCSALLGFCCGGGVTPSAGGAPTVGSIGCR